MKLAFFSSSDFVVPILKDIFDNQGKSIFSVAKTQLELLTNTSCYKVGFGNADMELQNLTKIKSNNNWDLLNSPMSLLLVISQPNQINRSKSIPNPITTFAKFNNIQVINPESFNEFRRLDFDPIGIDLGVTASYGQYVSKESLESTKCGFINWHPSLLPLYRGATPMQMTLLNGDKQGGISWIDMTPKMDEGNIYLQLSKTLTPQDNFATLSKEFGTLGSNTWAIAILNKLTNNLHIQDKFNAVLCSKLDKDNKYINLSAQIAKEIHNQFRAYIEFPFTVIPSDSCFQGDVKILECSISDFLLEEYKEYGNWRVAKNGKKQIVLLKCANNTLLEVTKIQLPTGKQIDFAGYSFG